MHWFIHVVSILLLTTLSASASPNETALSACVCAVRKYDPFTCHIPSLECPDDNEPLLPLVVPLLPLIITSVSLVSHTEATTSQKLEKEPLSTMETSTQPQATQSIHLADSPKPSTSSSTSFEDPSPSSYESQQGTPDILLSFEEWRKRFIEMEGKKTTRKRVTAGNRKGRQQIIDSLDGGLGDDVGSMFEHPDDGTPQAFYEPNQLSDVIPEKGSVDWTAPLRQRPPPAAEAVNPRVEEPTAAQSARPFTSSKVVAAKPKPSPADNVNILKKLKEKYNYASIDCAATVLSVNKEARGATSILYESKDQYMLNECSAKRFVIVNLCEFILIDTLVMANYEFFSSTFKDFRVWVADVYPPEEQIPPKKWELLGQWRARNTRDVQIFNVPNQEKWWQYIKIEFLSHYGHEYFCPLSLLRVHGTPQMEFFNLYEKPTMAPPDDEKSDDTGKEDEDETSSHDRLWPVELEAKMNQAPFVLPPIQTALHIPEDAEAFLTSLQAQDVEDVHVANQFVPHSTEAAAVVGREGNTSREVPLENAQQDQEASHVSTAQSEKASSSSPDVVSVVCDGEDCAAVVDHHNATNDTTHIQSPSTVTSPVDPPAPTPPLISYNASSSGHPATTDAMSPPAPPVDEHVTTSTPPPSASPSTTFPATDDAQQQKLLLNAYNPQPVPATGESIYKTIMKRLGMLELNATLSQRYLEEQNKMLHDVFTRMDQNHREQLRMLVGHLNETSVKRIEALKRKYEQLYQATLIEVEQQRLETTHELKELSSKVHIMADQ
ncbi:UNC-like C-terminal-domain-containing protein, partial [Jimgerdemannia flammicorona]